jgi:hypothetical protein
MSGRTDEIIDLKKSKCVTLKGFDREHHSDPRLAPAVALTVSFDGAPGRFRFTHEAARE